MKRTRKRIAARKMMVLTVNDVKGSYYSLNPGRDILSATILPLRILGLWSPRNDNDISNKKRMWHRIYGIYTFANVFGVFCYLVSTAITLKDSIHDLHHFTDSLLLSIVTFHTLAKTWPLVFRRRLVVRCVRSLDAVVGTWGVTPLASPSDTERRSAFLRYQRLISRCANAIVGTGFWCGMSWMLLPLVPSPTQLFGEASASNGTNEFSTESEPRHLAFPGWFPFDFEHSSSPRGYWAAYAFQLVTGTFNCMSSASSDVFYFALLFCSCLCLRALRKELAELPTNEPSRVHDAVRRHQMTLQLVEDLSAILGPVIFIHNLGMSMLLCAAVLHLLTSTLSGKFITVGSFVMYEMGELFIFCLLGTEIQSQSEACGTGAYCAPWYESPPAIQRTMGLVLLRAQKPALIRGFGITTLSLELFTALLKLSYSFYALLRQVAD